MFNVRPDHLWPWIRFEPLSEDPPAFRMAAGGSIRATGESGSGFPGPDSGTNPSAPFDIEFGNAYHAASSGFDRQGNGAGLIPSFGSGSLPPFATSLLFPRLTEPQTMWSGPQGHVGEPEARPDTSVPGLHHFKPPADDPPGLRVAADGSVRNGSPNDPNLWSLGHDPHADAMLPTIISSDVLRPFRDGSNPFDVLGPRPANTDPFPSINGGSLPPHATSLLFPQLAKPRFSWSGLLDDGGELDAVLDDPLLGFRVEPSTDESSTSRIPGDDSVGNDLSNHFDVSSFGYDPVAGVASPIDARSAGGIHSVGIDPTAYPTHFPALPRDPLQEALDQIARIYRIDWPGLNSRPTAFHDGRSAHGPTAAVGDAFDPRYIVPTGGGPVRPPPGPGHNGGPPLRPDSTSRIPTQPSRAAPSQANPLAQQPPDSSAAVAGAAAAGAAATEQLNEPSAADPEAAEKLEAWQRIVRVRGEEAPDSQYLGPSGRNTRGGVRLNPKLPEPAAGRGYFPALRHLRNGYRGELQLANRIIAALPNEVVIHYGMPAGQRGPDVISLSPNGTVSIWDSKWRSGERSIGLSQRAHQSKDSFEELRWELRRRIADAVRSGHLSPDVGRMARENVEAGNFDIYTIRTGNAHGGVAESVRDRIRSGTRGP